MYDTTGSLLDDGPRCFLTVWRVSAGSPESFSMWSYESPIEVNVDTNGSCEAMFNEVGSHWDKVGDECKEALVAEHNPRSWYGVDEYNVVTMSVFDAFTATLVETLCAPCEWNEGCGSAKNHFVELYPVAAAACGVEGGHEPCVDRWKCENTGAELAPLPYAVQHGLIPTAFGGDRFAQVQPWEMVGCANLERKVRNGDQTVAFEPNDAFLFETPACWDAIYESLDKPQSNGFDVDLCFLFLLMEIEEYYCPSVGQTRGISDRMRSSGCFDAFEVCFSSSFAELEAERGWGVFAVGIQDTPIKNLLTRALTAAQVIDAYNDQINPLRGNNIHYRMATDIHAARARWEIPLPPGSMLRNPDGSIPGEGSGNSLHSVWFTPLVASMTLFVLGW
eukprot:CAMPEP_0170747256 /NCGR_PEP_ID=MMETSP0437-20130122/9226_1 /TAXON_ID=0 /ORGANISM="Sexangularia sp." /LENGTH=390 /DNA_ID=CAMNT_0011086023 /DNA_START=37 /DNA_END=1206 /DNA_ORIENTATION=-